MCRWLMMAVAAAAGGLPAAAQDLARPEPAAEPAIARPCREAAEAVRPTRAQLQRCDRAVRQPDVAPPVRLAMLMNRGIGRLRAQQIALALADFDLAIKAAPGLAEAWINKGIALSRVPGSADEAVALISHGIQIGAKDPARALFARAQAQEAAGKLKEAMEDYGAAARADPDWPAPAEELKRFRVERRKVLRG